MIYNNNIGKEVYDKNLANISLEQKGYFKENDLWIAFDNSTGDLFLEEFKVEVEAVFWLSRFFEYSEYSDFKYFKIFRNFYYVKNTGFIRLVKKLNESKLI
nr:hypothetical protein [uncultured Brumimicrobium sp.]